MHASCRPPSAARRPTLGVVTSASGHAARACCIIARAPARPCRARNSRALEPETANLAACALDIRSRRDTHTNVRTYAPRGVDRSVGVSAACTGAVPPKVLCLRSPNEQRGRRQASGTRMHIARTIDMLADPIQTRGFRRCYTRTTPARRPGRTTLDRSGERRDRPTGRIRSRTGLVIGDACARTCRPRACRLALSTAVMAIKAVFGWLAG